MLRHTTDDIYDNCPETANWIERSGKSMRFLKSYLRSKMGSQPSSQTHEELSQMGGGYTWLCGGLPGLATYLQRSDVQKALHLGQPNRVQFG